MEIILKLIEEYFKHSHCSKYIDNEMCLACEDKYEQIKELIRKDS